jgi:alanine-glyoxylate transaminase/serine-glyoxylate transaminase/serine-pyruvate transaminase
MRPTGEVLLLTPGPTPIHPRALDAMQWPMRGHMDAEVFAYNDAIVADLRTLYGAADDAFASLLAGTGSLGMEAGLANLLEPGERLLVAVNGVFGERMVEMGRRLGAEVHEVRAPVGQPIDPADVAQALSRTAPKVVAVVHGETSTGVLNPLPEIAEIVRASGALLSVDAVTTVGMMPFDMQGLGVDYAYTGSQKCLSAPPGLAPVVYSRRAMDVIAARRQPVATWYADAAGMRAYWDPDGPRAYHHTIPVQLHWATGEAIRAALEEGLEAREARVRRLGAAILAALEPEGFAPFVAEPHRLPTVLALRLPPGLDDAAVRRELRSRYAISLTGGLGPTAGTIWRLGLMGENARFGHYHRLMEALAELLDAPGLPARFDHVASPLAV